MEKFAVDLQKVLDDFEYSEEQLREYSTEQPSLNNSFACDYNIYAKQYRPPTSTYRRPPFEPVTLADADFSISPRVPSTQFQTNYSKSSPPSTCSVIAESKQPIIRENSPVSNVDEESSFLLDNYSLPKNGKEFKPDLIESNTDLCSTLNEFGRIERHLPDVASANVEAKEERVNFDLINDSDELEITKCFDDTDEDVTRSKSNESSREVISFVIEDDDVTESELHQYLEELEQREFNNENILDKSSTVKTNADEINKISIKVEPELSAYSDKSEIDVDEATNIEDTNRGESNEARTTLRVDTCTGDVTTFKVKEDDSCANLEIKTSILSVENCENDDSEAEAHESVHTPDTEVTSVDFEEHTKSESLEDDVITNSNSDMNNEPKSSDSTIVTELDEEFDELNPFREEPIEQIVEKFDECVSHENVREKAETIEERTSTDDENAPEPEIMLDTSSSIHSSDSNYNILDSKTAISTFDTVSDTGTNSSRSQDLNDEQSECSVEHEPKLQRPDSLHLTHTTQNSEMSSTSADSGSLLSVEERKLGKRQPFWIPDSESTVCMHCQVKFTLVKRRHHCRACGLVLCSKCCDMKAPLAYLKYEEARVCHTCFTILERINSLESDLTSMKRPNPNNPMEYCSTIPPLLQVGPTQSTPPSVLVPVLKREGRPKTNDTPKQVMFSDGIRPGGDLSDLDTPLESRLPMRKHSRLTKRVGTPPGNRTVNRRMLNPETRSFIPSSNELPPLVTKTQGEYVFSEIEKPLNVDDKAVKFAINRNLFVIVQRIVLDCCVNRDVWCMTTEGLSCVGQDEVVFILEAIPEEKYPPKDVFSTINMLYQEAFKGTTVTEMSFASSCSPLLFGSKEHGGFVFIRPTYQCIQKLPLPKPPYLIALLVHRWETPWARLFPIRLVLRLGAEYRYYPCPLVSIRNRPALFTDIGHTIISVLVDFRKYLYSLPTVRGLMIHMEDRLTTILLPRNRYDQVIRAMNNSEENVLAFASNISTIADSHLVCIQSTQDDTSYTTQAINIHNKPRQVTGASFIVFNGSLKQCSWAGKSNIVEDGLMVQIPSDSMASLRNALKQMKDYSIGCGPQAEEVVMLKWAADDVNFNIGVKSFIDNKPLNGIPSIRVHNGTDYSGSTRFIRWTEVFILQSDEDCDSKTGDTVNINKLSESIARATCIALVPLLDLLATANLTTLAVRATIHPENVGYEAGCGGEKLAPLYMKSLDETLIAVVHEAALAIRNITYPIILELIFKIMEQG